MNRNRILHPHTGWQYVTVRWRTRRFRSRPSEAKVLNVSEAKASLVGKLSHYKKRAPYFEMGQRTDQ